MFAGDEQIVISDPNTDAEQQQMRAAILTMIDQAAAAGTPFDYEGMLKYLENQYGENSLEVEEFIDILRMYKSTVEG